MSHLRYEDFDEIVDHELIFCKFFKSFIDNHFELNSANFRQSVTEILGPGNHVLLAQDTGADEISLQCARLIQFGVHDTCLVVKRFSEFLKEYPQTRDYFINKGRIKMCCLVDGPAFEAIAISTVIDKVLVQFGFADSRRTPISIKVVSKDEKWKMLNKKLVQKADEQLKKATLQIEFYTTEFPNPFPEKVQEILTKAHIVTMVQFLSSDSLSKKNIKIIKNAIESTRKNAVFFYLDIETRNDYQMLSSTAEKCNPFTEVYFSPLTNKFNLRKELLVLDGNSETDCLWKSMNKNFKPTVCSVWIKANVMKITPNGEEKIKATQNGDKKKKTSTGLSSRKIRNTTEKFKLVGKFATMDLEKRYKDDSNRRLAIDKNATRYASHDDDD